MAFNHLNPETRSGAGPPYDGPATYDTLGWNVGCGATYDTLGWNVGCGATLTLGWNVGGGANDLSGGLTKGRGSGLANTG